MKNKKLINRLKRVSGQIDAITKQMEQGAGDNCLEVLQQLKASVNALKKFGEAYMTYHLEECLDKQTSSSDMKENLKAVISGAFSL